MRALVCILAIAGAATILTFLYWPKEPSLPPIQSHVISLAHTRTYEVTRVAKNPEDCVIHVILENDTSEEQVAVIRANCNCTVSAREVRIPKSGSKQVELQIPFSPDGAWLVSNVYISTREVECRLIVRSKRGYLSHEFLCSAEKIYFEGGVGQEKFVTIRLPESLSPGDVIPSVSAPRAVQVKMISSTQEQDFYIIRYSLTLREPIDSASVEFSGGRKRCSVAVYGVGATRHP